MGGGRTLRGGPSGDRACPCPEAGRGRPLRAEGHLDLRNSTCQEARSLQTEPGKDLPVTLHFSPKSNDPLSRPERRDTGSGKKHVETERDWLTGSPAAGRGRKDSALDFGAAQPCRCLDFSLWSPTGRGAAVGLGLGAKLAPPSCTQELDPPGEGPLWGSSACQGSTAWKRGTDHGWPRCRLLCIAT